MGWIDVVNDGVAVAATMTTTTKTPTAAGTTTTTVKWYRRCNREIGPTNDNVLRVNKRT